MRRWWGTPSPTCRGRCARRRPQASQQRTWRRAGADPARRFCVREHGTAAGQGGLDAAASGATRPGRRAPWRRRDPNGPAPPQRGVSRQQIAGPTHADRRGTKHPRLVSRHAGARPVGEDQRARPGPLGPDHAPRAGGWPWGQCRLPPRDDTLALAAVERSDAAASFGKGPPARRPRHAPEPAGAARRAAPRPESAQQKTPRDRSLGASGGTEAGRTYSWLRCPMNESSSWNRLMKFRYSPSASITERLPASSVPSA